MAWCVEEWVNLVLEKKAGTRKSLGHLLVNLVSNKLLQRAQVVQGIGNILEFAEEMICDIPKIWEFLGELIGERLLLYFFFLLLFCVELNFFGPGFPVFLTRLQFFHVRLCCYHVSKLHW